MRKIFFLSLLLSSALFASMAHPHPKLYQSLWPNFCDDHLLEGTACSEMDPTKWNVFWDKNTDSGNSITWIKLLFGPFFARTDIDQARFLEYQSLIPYLPKLLESCAYTHCDSCSQPVKKSLGLYGPDPEIDDCVIYHQCNCSYAIVDLTHENYATYETKKWHSCKYPAIPFAYFNRFTSQYGPFLRHHLEFCKEVPSCKCYWPYVSELACTISDLVYDRIHDLFQTPPALAEEWDSKYLFRYLLQNPRIPTYEWDSEEHVFYEEYYPQWRTELKEEFILRVLQKHFIFAFFYSNYQSIILDLCSYVDNHSVTSSHDLQKLYFILSSIRPLFLQLYSSCLEQHPHPKIFYERGMVHFHNGDLFAFLSDVKNFMNSMNDNTLLSSDLYLQEGSSYAELGLYDEAIQALTKSITKDPANKEAYFERASLYFETGDFERSIQDYLESGLKTTPINRNDFSSITFAKLLISGITKGTGEAIADFLPSLMASVNGLSHGLWAFTSAPQSCSKEIVNSCKQLLQFLSNNSSVEILEDFIPEIKELHNSQSDEERAYLLGVIIGKYGTEAFAPLGLVKAYKNIRSANRLLTLEHLAKASKESSILTEAATNWNKVHLDSIEKFRTGEKILNSFKDKLLTETTIRKIIHETGFATFPRPKGVPNNFKVTFSDKGCGMKYIHPENPHEYIRVMPGKPHSIQPHQTKPYVVYQKHGKTFDKFGNIVNSASPEAHIPIEEFVYKGGAHGIIEK